MTSYALGIDLGGTSLKAALVHREHGVVRRTQRETGAALGPAHVLGQLSEAARELLGALPPGEGLAGLGLGSPGVISWDRTTVAHPPNFPGWGVVNVAEALSDALGDALGMGVVVENDANVAGLGSAFYGAGRPFASFLMATLGTGVGGAIIHERRIFRGAHGGAGELGHVTIDYEGPFARSGVAGAIEAYLGAPFLAQHARARLLTRESTLHETAGPELAGLTPRVLHEAAVAGDEAAREVLAWAGHKLGAALGAAVNLLDIRKVVVGGGVSAAGDFLLAPARASLRRFVIPGMQEGLELVRETLGNEVALLGAARLAFKREEEANSG